MRKHYSGLFLTLLLALFTAPSYAQVVINEISNANGSTIDDNFGKEEDWIELYNASPASVNMQNYALSDDEAVPRKWIFPAISIPSHGFLLVFASKRDVVVNNYYLHCNFKLASEGCTVTLHDPGNTLLDSYTLSVKLQPDHSVGRSPDGSVNWGFFNAPSPRQTNNSAVCYAGYEPDPVFSAAAGFYSSPQNIAINAPSSTGVVHYTLNDRTPGASSPAYIAPVNMSATGVVAARTYSTGNKLPSNIVKHSYFINEQGLDLPVFSITTDSLNLWSQDSGIYVTGPNADPATPHYGANYWMDWERSCYVEFFDKNNVKQFGTEAGLKIFGGYSRAFDQKSFKLKFRDKYGESPVKYTFIDEKPRLTKYKDLILRNGGSDCEGTRFRDALMQRLVKGANADIMAYEPALVFLNGQFWGEYEMREKQDPKYIERNYNIPVENIDFLSHEGVIITQAGSDTSFYSMYNYITSANPTDPSFYTNVSKKLDIENYTDYFIAETYYGNKDWLGDWVNNIRLWRPHTAQGKWRYMLWDLDWGGGLYSSPNTDYLSRARYPMVPNEQSDIFNAMLNNTQFRNYFVNRYADMINTTFSEENVQAVSSQMRDEISNVMQRHAVRWNSTYSGWLSEVSDVLSFNSQRIGYARTQVQNHFGLAGQVTVELDAYPAGAGKIRISTITPSSLPWNGVYFNGVPVTITAIANSGYSFDHWEATGVTVENNRSVTLNIPNDARFTAHFKEGEYEMTAYPNPFTDHLDLTYNMTSEGNISVKLYSVTGKEALTLIDGSLMAEGEHTISVDLSRYDLAEGMYFVRLQGSDFTKTIRIVKTSKSK